MGLRAPTFRELHVLRNTEAEAGGVAKVSSGLGRKAKPLDSLSLTPSSMLAWTIPYTIPRFQWSHLMHSR